MSELVPSRFSFKSVVSFITQVENFQPHPLPDGVKISVPVYNCPTDSGLYKNPSVRPVSCGKKD